MAGVDLESVGVAELGLADEPGRPRQRAVSVEDSGMGDPLRFDAERLRILVERHLLFTGSTRARALLEDWDTALSRFVKVMPREYRRALLDMRARSDSDRRHCCRRVGTASPGHAVRFHPGRSRRLRQTIWRRSMGKVTGFLEIERHDRATKSPNCG